MNTRIRLSRRSTLSGLFIVLATTFGMILPSSSAFSQKCEWKFVNSLKCQLKVQLKLQCGNNRPIISESEAVAPGTWEVPQSSLLVLPNEFCSFSNERCAFYVIINGVEYKETGRVCCGPTDKDCEPNWCGELKIDPSTHTIYLSKPGDCH